MGWTCEPHLAVTLTFTLVITVGDIFIPVVYYIVKRTIIQKCESAMYGVFVIAALSKS